MSLYQPGNLSPKPRKPLSCALPFGLSWEDLLSILPGVDQQQLSRAQAFITHEKQGLHGGDNSLILTLFYPRVDDNPGSVTVFIKQMRDQRKAEVEKYRFLASQNVPTPRLLAFFQKEGGEVFVLEFISTIGINFQAGSEVKRFLQAIARLNSIQKTPIDFISFPGSPQSEFDELVRTALVEIAEKGTGSIETSRWYDAYRISQEVVQSMPLAVNHNELYFQQVGWVQRGLSRRLVIFDLETMHLSPRFTDIATILYPLSVYSKRDQIGLFQIYLDHLSRLTHTKIENNAALRELRLLRIVESCYSLPWLVSESRDPSNVEMYENLAMVVKCLQEDLTNLEMV